MRLSRAARNVGMVVLAFGGMAALIVLSHYRPPARVLPPESDEIARLRFSRTENAWFVLMDATDNVPPRPKVDPRTTVDFEPGFVGQFTGVELPDDNPEHLTWVRACRPAVDRARDALAMKHLLMAIEFEGAGEPWRRIYQLNNFRQLSSLALATAALELKSGGDPKLVLTYFKDALRLSLMLKTSIPHSDMNGPKSLCSLVRRFTPEAQREAFDWLREFDQSKPPPRRAAEDLLRMNESWKGGWKQQFLPVDPQNAFYVTRAIIHSGPARRVFATNVNEILDACTLTIYEYREWAKFHPQLSDAAGSSFPGYTMEHPICYENSWLQIRLDVMQLVLAIELFRSGHGSYPDSLESLIPEFLPELPRNALTNDPYFYQRAAVDYWFGMPRGTLNDPGLMTYADTLVSPPETQGAQ